MGSRGTAVTFRGWLGDRAGRKVAIECWAGLKADSPIPRPGAVETRMNSMDRVDRRHDFAGPRVEGVVVPTSTDEQVAKVRVALSRARDDSGFLRWRVRGGGALIPVCLEFFLHRLVFGADVNLDDQIPGVPRGSP